MSLFKVSSCIKTVSNRIKIKVIAAFAMTWKYEMETEVTARSVKFRGNAKKSVCLNESLRKNLTACILNNCDQNYMCVSF